MKTMIESSGDLFPRLCNRNLGVSEEAKEIRKKSDELNEKHFKTISYGDQVSRIIESLIRLSQEYNKENWDGYGAEPISAESFKSALVFGLSLPSTIPIPEMDVIPTGKVMFSWNRGSRKVFSVIVGESQELSYAGLFGFAETYGIEYITDCIPETILTNIGKVYT